MPTRPFVLVHAPLVGPTTWRWVADELRRRGEDVDVPDVHAACATPTPRGYAEALASSVRGRRDAVLVAHSGAGMILPSAAAMVDGFEGSLVFVDAGFPQPADEALTGGAFREWLDTLVGPDGVLPPWHTWWGAEGMAAMVPDAVRRSDVERDMPRLPLSYFDAVADAPPDWSRSRCSYVLCSETYRPFAATASELGWRTTEVRGTHLEIVNQPDRIADAILGVLA